VGRLRAIPRALRDDVALYQALLHVEGRHATPDEIALAHDRDYITAVERMARAGGGSFDPDTVCSEGTWDAATAAVGCLLDAIDMAFDGRAERSFCGVRPPGHHALRARAMGFCVFGNVAIAARYARTRHGVDRVLILDWDVHHGNGTQALVEDVAAIHFVSMHQWPWYPGTGPAGDRGPHGSVWNIPMAAGLPAVRYRDGFLAGLDAATAGWTPDVVLVSCGFDSLRGDPLGGFTLEIPDLEGLMREVVARAAHWCGGRVIASLEGGYVPEQVGAGALAMMRAMR
jgi:acetoin utilization deacetylase AcuC-like enzyme